MNVDAAPSIQQGRIGLLMYVYIIQYVYSGAEFVLCGNTRISLQLLFTAHTTAVSTISCQLATNNRNVKQTYVGQCQSIVAPQQARLSLADDSICCQV